MSMTATSPGIEATAPATPAGPCLILDDVAVMRGGRLIQTGVSHSLPAGHITLVTGPNGCGKSSLIRAIAGRLPLFNGRIQCDLPMVYIGHTDGLSPALSGRTNLANWAALYGYTYDVGAIAAALTALDATRFADVPIGHLSRGQRRRMSLARLALAPASTLWLLDEPNVGLDTASVALLDAMIGTHLGGGGMVFAASHLPLGPDMMTRNLVLRDNSDHNSDLTGAKA